MFKRLIPLLAALAATSAFAQVTGTGPIDNNYDIVNNGPDAYDFAVVLQGVDIIDATYDGLNCNSSTPITFKSVTEIQVGNDMLIHWTNPVDPRTGQPSVIKAGSKFHIGFSTRNDFSKVKDMYFTDKFGQRIKCSTVVITGGHWETGPGPTVSFTNLFDVPVTLRAPQFMVAPARIALPQLNPCNREIMAQLQPLAADMVIQPGATVLLPVPAKVPPGSSVVLVHSADGDGNTGSTLAFTQVQVPAGTAAAGKRP